MKKIRKFNSNKKILALCFFTLIMLSACEKEDDDISNNSYILDYFSLEVGNQWVYSLTIDDDWEDIHGIGECTVSVESQNGNVYTLHKIEVLNGNVLTENTYTLIVGEEETTIQESNNIQCSFLWKTNPQTENIGYFVWYRFGAKAQWATQQLTNNGKTKIFDYHGSSTNLGYTCGTDSYLKERLEKGKGVTYFTYKKLTACIGINTSKSLEYVYTLKED
jgi:hypothetical protein